jgi:hypothetical protein
MPLNHASQFAALTETQYSALGKIVVEWSNIEYLLGVLLSRLLYTPEYLGRTYADGMTAVRLQSAISEAVAIHKDRYGAKRIAKAQLKLIEDINERVAALRADRNRVSHFCWTRWSDDEIFGTSLTGGVHDAKRKRKANTILKLSELKRLHVEAHALTEELIRIIEDLPKVSE